MYTESRQAVQKHLTPKDAEELLALNNFPHQRPYKPIVGRKYADNMKDGAQRRIEVAVAKVKENGTSYLVNGQHCCNAVMIYGKPYPATVSYYSCDTMEDAWRLFASFDVHLSRTERLFMGARREMFEDERLRNTPLRVLECCGTALYALGSGSDPRFGVCAKVKTDKADAVALYSDEVNFVAKFNSYDALILVPVVTAMIATWRKNPAAAGEFWGKVATGEMLTPSDQRMKLRDVLSKRSAFSSMRGRDRNAAIYATCVSWWNSWRTGEQRRSVKLNAMNAMPKVSA